MTKPGTMDGCREDHSLVYYEKKPLHVFLIPVFAGIFSFIYWFVFCMLLRTYLQRPRSEFWGYLMIALILWLMIMSILLLIWWYMNRKYRNQAKDEIPVRVKISKKEGQIKEDYIRDSPEYPTKITTIQPSDPTSIPSHRSRYSYPSRRAVVGADASILMQTVPVQLRQTKSVMYNGESYNKNHPASGISVSSGSLETAIQDAECNLPAKLEPLKKVENSLEVRVDNTEKATQVEVEEAVERVTLREKRLKQQPSAPLLRDTSFTGLPEFQNFDSYLHLVKIDTPLSPETPASPLKPLSPREIFFSDLIKQAEENEMEAAAKGVDLRKSYCLGDTFIPVHTADRNRKSVPLYLYFGKNVDEAEKATKPEKGVTSITHADAAEKPSKAYPRANKEFKKSVSFETKSEESPVDVGSKHDIEGEPANATNPSAEASKRESLGEYFIANVERTKSETSQVYLKVDGDPQPVKYYETKEWDVTNANDIDDCGTEQTTKWIIVSENMVQDMKTDDNQKSGVTSAYSSDRGHDNLNDDDDNVFN